jgi:hypothetical protein
LPFGGRDERVHIQIRPNDRLLYTRRVRNLRLYSHGATRAMWQDRSPILSTRVLVGVDHVTIATQPPRVARLGLSIPAQLAAGIYRLTELTNDPLGALGRDAETTPLGPPLSARLARPRPVEAACAVMAAHHVTPQPRRLLAASGKGGPSGCRAWSPCNFYPAIAHSRRAPDRRPPVKLRVCPCGPPSFHPHT